MDGVQLLLIITAAVGGIVLAVALIGGGKPLRRLLGSAVQGWCAVAAVNGVGMFSGVFIGLNAFSMATSGVLGVPGVIALLLLKAVFTT